MENFCRIYLVLLNIYLYDIIWKISVTNQFFKGKHNDEYFSKIHKENIPVRPIAADTKTSAYNLAKQIIQI